MLPRLLLVPLRRLSSAGAILCYHSVTDEALPAESTVHVSLREFAAAVEALRGYGEIVRLAELVERHRSGRSTAGLVAITFDDAYAALPLLLSEYLQRARVPITVFAVANALQSGARFWWDRLDDLFPRVEATRWREFERACGLPEAYRVGQPREFGPLRPLRQWILASGSGRWPAHLEPPLAELEAELGVQTKHRSMSLEELRRFAMLDEVDVGVHTSTHPVLPLLSDEELAAEVAGCFRFLREQLPVTLPYLSIPFGLFDERTLRLARDAGMAAAFTLAEDTIRGELAGGLPRFCVTRSGAVWKLPLQLAGVRGLMRRRPGRARYPELPSATS